MLLRFKAKIDEGRIRVPELKHSHLVSPLMNTSQFNLALWRANRRDAVPRPGWVALCDLPPTINVSGEGYLRTVDVVIE